MKHNWTYKKLTDVCGIQYGFPFDSHCFTDDSSFPPLIRIRDVMRGFSETFYNGDVPEDYYVKAGEYLIGMDGEFNIAPWRSEKALLNQRVCKIYSSDANTSIHFIYYSLIKLLKQIEAETPSVTVKHLSAKRLNQIELPIPSLSEQESIVAELDAINHLIDLQEQQLREYDRLAQSLFHTTFGDPATNPKGWEVKKLGEVCRFLNGDRGVNYPSAKDFVAEGIPFINAGHLQNGKICFEDMNYISKERFDLLHAGKVQKDDILFCLRGSLGKFAIVDFDDFGAIASSLVIIRSLDVAPLFIVRYLQTSAVKEQIERANNGSSQPNLSAKSVADFKLPLPPLPLQQAFAAQIEAIEQQKALIRRSLDETRTLLAARMQYYFE